MLTDIKDFRRIDTRVATSGHVTEAQIAEIAAAGYEVVINLLPSSAQHLHDEDVIVAEAGMQYIGIPIVWTSPQVAQARQFFDVMDARQHRKVWVHCAANMRVSAFVYLWRTLRHGVDEDAARADLDAIWTPNPVWQKFLQEVQTSG